MNWWAWLLVGAAVPQLALALVWLVGRESNERKRGGLIDLTGTHPTDRGANR